MLTLMQEIRAFPVEKRSVAMWWLGQNGYIFKTPEGTLLSTDMYLTDSCAPLGADAGMDLARRVPVLIRPEELDVDLLVRSKPENIYRGKLSFLKVAQEANPNRDDNNESEPVITATVRIDGDDIPAADRLPRDLLLTGTEVHAKVRCGNHAMGYSLFYGVWEFMYEKVVFFF